MGIPVLSCQMPPSRRGHRRPLQVFAGGYLAQFPLENRFITIFLSRNFNLPRGTTIQPQSMACKDAIGFAKEKHQVSTSTLGTQINWRPFPGANDHIRADPVPFFPEKRSPIVEG